MKFQKTIILTSRLVAHFMNLSFLGCPTGIQIGQYVRVMGKLGRVELISTSGVDVRFREDGDMIIKLIRPESFPSFETWENIRKSLSPRPLSTFEMMIDSLSLPLVGLAGGVALLLLTLIY
jgi:hypothetical protein